VKCCIPGGVVCGVQQPAAAVRMVVGRDPVRAEVLAVQVMEFPP
jgi:hypothetical protein